MITPAPDGPALITRVVDVDGLSMRARVAGLDRGAPGVPVVVFEGGGGAPLETWDPILPAVAAFAPLVAYDRAGTGQSAWDGEAPAPERVVTRLRRLLSTLDARPPYVLVGHSWGGVLVRHFAGAHPEDVASILYIDPTDITLTRADMVALFESFGAGAAEYDSFMRTMREAMASAPPQLRAESDVIVELFDRDLENKGLPPVPSVSASVILAGRVVTPPAHLVPFDGKAYAEAMHASNVRRLRTWVTEGGRFRIASNAGHDVHAHEPELVVEELRRLVRGGR